MLCGRGNAFLLQHGTAAVRRARMMMRPSSSSIPFSSAAVFSNGFGGSSLAGGEGRGYGGTTTTTTRGGEVGVLVVAAPSTNSDTGRRHFSSSIITAPSSRLLNGSTSRWQSTTLTGRPCSNPRYFSTEDGGTTDDGDNASAELSSILQREIDEELDNQTTDIPPELSTLQSEIENDWRIVEGGPGGGSSKTAIVKMYKKEPAPNGAKVMVEFHCQDTIDDEDDVPMMADEEGGGEVVEEEEPASSVRFQVTVTRGGKCLVLDCVSRDATVDVEGAMVKDSDGGDGGGADISAERSYYQGPVFMELVEDLQDAMVVYVQEDCGLNQDVCAYIAMMADYKEQVEYVNWMKAVKSLVQ